jgi:hypothetical protein
MIHLPFRTSGYPVGGDGARLDDEPPGTARADGSCWIDDDG